MKSVHLSLQDSNLLVQRNMLEILLYFFPFAEVLVGKHTRGPYLLPETPGPLLTERTMQFLPMFVVFGVTAAVSDLVF